MNRTDGTIGIIASDECKTRPASAKHWFHLAKFVQTYHQLLLNFRILATDSTSEFIESVIEGDKKSPFAPLSITRLGQSFQGVVKMGAMVARGEVQRVLMFHDPHDLQIERPETYALLRNCNISGRMLYMNAAAHLWALHECVKRGIEQNEIYNLKPVDRQRLKETVVFIAHDAEKLRMARFVLHYRSVLNLFPRLMATSGTKRFIDKHLTASVPKWERPSIVSAGARDKEGHGPSGGDVVIADEIFETHKRIHDKFFRLCVLYHILFFVDHKHAHPHEPDIQVLLKTCVNPEHRVNLILNSRMAEEWAERYRHCV